MIAFMELAAAVAIGLASPEPSTSPCARPNVPPTTNYAAEPVLPWEVARLGRSGSVVVQITLDAESRVAGVRIHTSAFPDLNAYALDAARRSKFQTEMRNCVAIPGSYLFSVDVVSDDAPPYVDTAATPPTAAVNGRGIVDAPVTEASVSMEFVAEEASAAAALNAVDAAYQALQDRLSAREIAWRGTTDRRKADAGSSGSRAFARLQVRGEVSAERAPEVIAAAASAHAWSAHVAYALPTAARSAAASRAVADATEFAATLARAHGLKVDHLVSFETTRTSGQPERRLTSSELRSGVALPDVRTYPLTVYVRATFALKT